MPYGFGFNTDRKTALTVIAVRPFSFRNKGRGNTPPAPAVSSLRRWKMNLHNVFGNILDSGISQNKEVTFQVNQVILFAMFVKPIAQFF